MKSTHTRWVRSATAEEGASPISGRSSARVAVSNTNGISAAWQAPNPWLSRGSGWSNRYIQVSPAPAEARASATRMGGMRKNQSVITAASRSPGLAPGRLPR